MKKIIILLILLGLSIVKVNAEEWSEWSEVLPEKENIEIETEIRYKWYKEEKIDFGYVSKVEDVCEYLDESDKTVKKTISITLPDEKENRIIKPIQITFIKDINYTSTIHFFNLDHLGKVLFTEAEIYNTKTKSIIPYEITDHTDFPGDVLENLYDKNINETAASFEYYDKISMTLDKFYNTKNLVLKLYFKESSPEFNKINFAIGHDKYEYIGMGIMENISAECKNGICILSIPLIDYIRSNGFETYINAYEYEDVLYKCYKKNKEYLNGYYTFIEDYVKDEDTAKTFYRYKNIKVKEMVNEEENREPIEITYKKIETETETIDEVVEENKEKAEETKESSIAIASEKENKKSIVPRVTIVIIITCLALTIVTILIKEIKKYHELRRMK